MQRMLAAAYKKGADTIIIHCSFNPITEYILERVNNFIGIEVVDRQPGKLTLQTLVHVESSMDSLMNKIMLLSRTIMDELCEGLASQDEGRLNSVVVLEKTQNKLTDAAKRILAKRESPNQEDKYLYSFIVEQERLVDEFKYIAKLALKQKPAVQTVELCMQVQTYVHAIFDVIRKKLDNIKEVSQQYLDLLEEATDFSEDPLVRMHLNIIITKVYELGETVLEWKLDS